MLPEHIENFFIIFQFNKSQLPAVIISVVDIVDISIMRSDYEMLVFALAKAVFAFPWVATGKGGKGVQGGKGGCMVAWMTELLYTRNSILIYIFQQCLEFIFVLVFLVRFIYLYFFYIVFSTMHT